MTINRSTASAGFTVMHFSTGTLIGTATAKITAVPEPAIWLSLLAGIGMLAFWRAPRAGRAMAG